MHPQPPPITQLIQLLHHQSPEPAQLEITILPDRILDCDDGGDDQGGDDDYDDSDYYYLKDDIHLGIHAPNVPHLARIFRNEYYSLRTKFKKESAALIKCKNNSNANNDENNSVLIDAVFLELQRRLFDVTTCLLLICPDHASAWSDRKRIMLQRQQKQQLQMKMQSSNDDDCRKEQKGLVATEIWLEEIRFLNLLFTQHSKAPNSWSHRKWVSKQIFTTIQNNYQQHHLSLQHEADDTNILNLESRVTIVSQWTQNELDICSAIAQKYPKNYYAWTHRRFVIDSLIEWNQLDIVQKRNVHPQRNDSDDSDKNNSMNKGHRSHLWQILQSEYEFLNNWMIRHVSDHSAVHYGGEILRIMIFLKCTEGRYFWNKLGDGNKDDGTAIHGRYGHFYHVYNRRYFGLGVSHQSFPEDEVVSHHCCSQPEQNDNIAQYKEDKKYDKWVMDLLYESFTKSLELIQKYPSNEVVWIWRRICFQIYIDYVFGVMKSYCMTENIEQQVEEDAAVCDCEELIQKDIESFVTQDNLAMEDEYDQRHYKLYSITYILWLLEHFQRYQNRGVWEKNIHHDKAMEKQKYDCMWQELRSRLVSDLAGGDHVSTVDRRYASSNMWTIKKEQDC